MKTCPSCQASAESDARFCLDCGHAFGDGPAPADDPWLGRLVADRFRLIDKLGDGGMGEVFRAEQLPIGRPVALKILRQSLADNPQQVERFKREAQAVSQLSHPNTIIVHDFGQDEDGTLFIAMELLEGQSLDKVLDEGVLTPARAVHILAQVCGSLSEAHERSMVHRDLKPENIFLTERAGSPDFVKVLDFGIAKVTHGTGGDRLETITRAGAIFGTPQYMAPEQIRGGDLDARADVYALGVVLYQMIAGQLPFAAGTVVEMLTKHLSAQPAPITREHASPEDDLAYARLEAVALRALSKDPSQRQPSARAFLEDLMAAVPNVTLNPMTGLFPTAAPDFVPAPVETPAPEAGGRSSSGLVVFATALIVAGAAAGWFFLRGPAGGGGGDGAVPAVLAQDAEGGAPTGGDQGTETQVDPEAAKKAADEAAAKAKAEAEAKAKAEAAAKAKAEADQKAAAEAAAAEEAKKAEAAAEAAAAAEAKKAEEAAKKAEAEAAKPMSDAEAKQVAAQAEAERKAAEDARKAAEAEEKRKATAEAKAKAEQQKAASEAAKLQAQEKAAAAEAARLKAEEAAAAAKAAELKAQEQAAAQAAKAAEAAAQKQAAEAQAQQSADAKAKAEAAAKKAAAEKAKAEAAAKAAAQAKAKAEADSAAAKAARQAAEAKAQKAAADKARLEAEAAALRAKLQKIEDERAAAAAKAEEERLKAEAAKAKAKAAKKKKRPKRLKLWGYVTVKGGAHGAKVMVDGRMRGRVPMRRPLKLKKGSHTIKVGSRSKRVKVIGGKRTSLRF